MSGYKHIFWDWNGTLLNDVWLGLEIINGMLKRRNMPLQTREMYRTNFCFPVIEYYKVIGFDLEQESFVDLSHEFMDEYEARRFECRLNSGAVEALNILKAKGIGQSVLSAYKLDYLQQALKHYEIIDYFEDVAGHTDIFAKGKVETGLKLMERLNLKKGEAVLIGDTEHDHEVAEAIGADCILFTNGHHNEDKLSARNVPVSESLSRIIDLLYS